MASVLVLPSAQRRAAEPVPLLFPARRVEDQYSLRGQLKQESIARFGVTQLGVLTLHRLLGVQQTLLQLLDGAQIAPDRDDAAGVSD